MLVVKASKACPRDCRSSSQIHRILSKDLRLAALPTCFFCQKLPGEKLPTAYAHAPRHYNSLSHRADQTYAKRPMPAGNGLRLDWGVFGTFQRTGLISAVLKAFNILELIERSFHSAQTVFRPNFKTRYRNATC